MVILGLHGGVTMGQHEPGAAIARDGKIVAACEEERYLRIKSCYGRLPHRSIEACLKIAGIDFSQVDLVVVPGITYPDVAKRWELYLQHLFGSCPTIEVVHHQQAHLAAAFYGSTFDEAMVVSLDATGDGSCGMIARASRTDGLQIIEELPTNRSLGFFYTLMTYYLGFEDGDEYKVMGLAPYADSSVDLNSVIRETSEGWDFDWSFVRSEPPCLSPFEPLYAKKLADALGRRHRLPGEKLDAFYTAVAGSTQQVFEESLLNFFLAAQGKAGGLRNVCFAGGLALNCAANKRLLYSDSFDRIYVSPVSSDRGLAIGCAYLGASSRERGLWPMHDAYLGSDYSDDQIEHELRANGCSYQEVKDPADAAADLIADGKVIGWFQGRSEAGARALGNRSILASCASAEMKERVNARIKYREEFRPFAPAVMQEHAATWFEMGTMVDSPYMTFTVDTKADKRERIPAVVHRDGTARLQTVRSSQNELYYRVIQRYFEQSGIPVILNTSFNLKGQPIVETPRDAIMTYFGCGLDALVMGNFLLVK